MMPGVRAVNRTIKKMITRSDLLLKGLDLLTDHMPRVFVWHRFTPPGLQVGGRVSADEFAWQLDQIVRQFRVLSLGDMLDYHGKHGKWPHRAAVMTIDDGYRDFYQWAYPELKKRGMSATFFATVNFVEGKIWLWPDRLQWMIEKTTQAEVFLPFLNGPGTFPLHGRSEKAAAWKSCCDYCISLPNDRKEAFIGAVEEALRVTCPAKPTEEYRAVTWDQLREMADNGIEIGSHTMNHPILSRIAAATVVDEACTSKKILEERLARPVGSFCYPNSGPGDITEDVVAAVQGAGYTGAVFGTDLKLWTPFRIPRMGVDLSRTGFLWKLYGGESL